MTSLRGGSRGPRGWRPSPLNSYATEQTAGTHSLFDRFPSFAHRLGSGPLPRNVHTDRARDKRRQSTQREASRPAPARRKAHSRGLAERCSKHFASVFNVRRAMQLTIRQSRNKARDHPHSGVSYGHRLTTVITSYKGLNWAGTRSGCGWHGQLDDSGSTAAGTVRVWRLFVCRALCRPRRPTLRLIVNCSSKETK